MDSFFQKAKTSISKLTKKIGKPSDAPTDGSPITDTSSQGEPGPSASSASTGTSPGGKRLSTDPQHLSNSCERDSSDGSRSKRKVHTINVHPLLDKAFDDDITPPRSPIGSSAANSASKQRHQSSTPMATHKGGSLHQPHNTTSSSVPVSPAASGQLGASQPASTTGGGGRIHSARSDASLSSSSTHDGESTTPKHQLKSGCSSSSVSSSSAFAPPAVSIVTQIRIAEVRDILAADCVDMAHLRRVCWSGCPAEVRQECWALLTGYHPPQSVTRLQVVQRKRTEYATYLRRSYDNIEWATLIDAAGASSGKAVTAIASATVGQEEIAIMKQIRKDVPRTSGGMPFLHHVRVMQTLERVLYIWALRHPACGYVQGMNDLVLPFLHVALGSTFASTKPHGTTMDLGFLSEKEVDRLFDVSNFDDDKWLAMEADLYWMSSKLLNGLQENFTYNQAGVHSMVRKLEKVTEQVDSHLAHHLDDMGIPFTQFAFRWMNCMLIREFAIPQILRLWDTYLSEETIDVCSLHVFICASLLSRWSRHICAESDFSNVMTFLQNPPTDVLKERDMDELISEGFLKYQLYGNSNSVQKAGH